MDEFDREYEATTWRGESDYAQTAAIVALIETLSDSARLTFAGKFESRQQLIRDLRQNSDRPESYFAAFDGVVKDVREATGK